jgi:hypothetical protein
MERGRDSPVVKLPTGCGAFQLHCALCSVTPLDTVCKPCTHVTGILRSTSHTPSRYSVQQHTSPTSSVLRLVHPTITTQKAATRGLRMIHQGRLLCNKSSKPHGTRGSCPRRNQLHTSHTQTQPCTPSRRKQLRTPNWSSVSTDEMQCWPTPQDGGALHSQAKWWSLGTQTQQYAGIKQLLHCSHASEQQEPLCYRPLAVRTHSGCKNTRHAASAHPRLSKLSAYGT